MLVGVVCFGGCLSGFVFGQFGLCLVGCMFIVIMLIVLFTFIFAQFSFLWWFAVFVSLVVLRCFGC